MFNFSKNLSSNLHETWKISVATHVQLIGLATLLLFMSCPLAKVVWCIVHVAFKITPLVNNMNPFGNSLSEVTKKDESHWMKDYIYFLFKKRHL
jgi:hypothetical protein